MSQLKIEQVGSMSPIEERRFWVDFERELANDDGAAASEHLAAGRPIHYCDDRYPDDIVRRWPDGRIELIAVDLAAGGTITVKKSL